MAVPWYWIVIIVSAVIGPFQAFSAYNKMLMRRKARAQREAADAAQKAEAQRPVWEEDEDLDEK